MEQIRAGKLRSITMTTETRLDLLTDLPTVSEIVAAYEASGWLGNGTHGPAGRCDRCPLIEARCNGLYPTVTLALFMTRL
jgi:hypothetical protein